MSPIFLAKQPQNDITLLMKELVTIGVKVPTTPEGGNNGHTGIIIEDSKCQQMTKGTASITTVNPELYPKIAANVSTGKRAKDEAEQKDLKQQNKIFCTVEQGMKDEILKAVDNDYLLEIKNEMLGHLNQKPKQMLTHLKNRGDQLDYVDTKKLLADCNSKWDPNEVPKALNELSQLQTGEPRVRKSSQVTNNTPKQRVETFKVTFNMILLVHAQEGTPEPRAKNQEPRAKSQEPRAKSQEPGAKSQEPRAKS
jgi:hypothetical protein